MIGFRAIAKAVEALFTARRAPPPPAPQASLLQPAKIQDIVFRIHEYLPEMRKTDGGNTLLFLDSYVTDYFAKAADVSELKKMSVELTDRLYHQISAFDRRDVCTDGYFGLVVNHLFWNLSQLGILCFFILDNGLRDDRFKMTVELYKSSGFAVIYPYMASNLQHSDKYTRLETRDYKAIEKEIGEARSQKRHILYVEKDDSINHLDSVLHLAEEFQNEYICIFRNQAPNDHPDATVLMGSFGNILKT